MSPNVRSFVVCRSRNSHETVSVSSFVKAQTSRLKPFFPLTMEGNRRFTSTAFSLGGDVMEAARLTVPSHDVISAIAPRGLSG